MGSYEYIEAQRRLKAQGEGGFLDGLKAKTRAEIDEWQAEMQLKATRVGAVHLYADGLRGEHRGLTGVTMIDDVRAAVAASVAKTGDRNVAVIPEGPYVVPRYRPPHGATAPAGDAGGVAVGRYPKG